MQTPRMVPGIARGPQQFSREDKPPITHPMGGYNPDSPGMPTANRTQTYSPEATISEAVRDLGLEIYARLVVGRQLDSSYTSDVDREQMGEIAKFAQAAALAYFEQMGVKFDD